MLCGIPGINIEGYGFYFEISLLKPWEKRANLNYNEGHSGIGGYLKSGPCLLCSHGKLSDLVNIPWMSEWLNMYKHAGNFMVKKMVFKSFG